MEEQKQFEVVKKDSPVEPTTGNQFIGMIERLSTNPNINVDTLQKVIEMQERVLDRNAKQAYAAAMVRAESKIKKVLKNQSNTQTKSRYADLEAVCAMATPIYTAEGLALSFYEGDAPKPELVRTYVDIIHEEGHMEKRHIDLEIDDKGIQGSKNKTAIHGKGSTFSYGRRYLTCMVFNIPTGDDDDGNSSGKQPEYITSDQADEITALLGDTGTDSAKWLKWFSTNKKTHIESVATIPASLFKSAKTGLEKKKKEQADQREPGCEG